MLTSLMVPAFGRGISGNSVVFLARVDELFLRLLVVISMQKSQYQRSLREEKIVG
jgi:hypothetical protein